MKAMRKKAAGLAALPLVLSLLLSGCWDGRELDTLAIVTGVGIDRAENNMVTLTLQISKTSEDSSGNSYVASQKTSNGIIQSFRDFTHSSSRRLMLQHNQVIVFGRTQAEHDVTEPLDFFVRDHETRMDVWVFIADGMGSEILTINSQIEKLPSEHLSRLQLNQHITSESYGTDLLHLIQSLRGKSQAAAVSFVTVIDDDGSPMLNLSGLAIVKKNHMVGTMNHKETLGFRWIQNDVNSGLLPLYTEYGKAFLEIKSSKTKLSISMKDDVPHVKLMIDEHVSLAELMEFSAVPLRDMYDILVEEGKALIEESVLASLQKAQELNADVFGFADLLYQYHFKDWKKIAHRWDELFPRLELEVEVKMTMDAIGKFIRLGKGNVVLMYA